MSFARNSSLRSTPFLSLAVSFTLSLSNGADLTALIPGIALSPRSYPPPRVTAGPIVDLHMVPVSQPQCPTQDSTSFCQKWTFPPDISLSVNGTSVPPVGPDLKSWSCLDSFGSLAPINMQSPIPVTSLPEVFATFFPITGTQIAIPLTII